MALHAVILWAVPEQRAVAMPAGSTPSSVSLNLVSAPQPQSKPQPKSEPEAVPEPVVKKTPPPEPKKEAPKKAVTKTVKKKPQPEKTAKVVKKEQPVKPPEPVQTKQPEKAEVKPQESKPAPSSQGASNKIPVIEEPQFRAKPVQPGYPRLARKRGIEGTATWEVWIDEDGKQLKQVLVSSSGTQMLDKAALKAIKKWQFSPHQVNGMAVAHRVKIPVRFTLD